MKTSIPFSRKLKGYSMLTGSILASAAVADAQVIYTDINPDFTSGPYQNMTYEMDLNNDGINDLTIEHDGDQGETGYVWYDTNYLSAWAAAGNSVAVENNVAKALDSGNLIGSNLNWDNDGQLAMHRVWTFDYSGSQVIYSGGAFLGEYNKYLALRFTVSGNQYYGWVRLSVNSWGDIFTIHDYAYESTPDVPIVAGDTGCSSPTAYYADSDNDGFGNSNNIIEACIQPTGFVLNGNDCDDTNAAVNPAATPVKQWDIRYGGTSADKLDAVQQTTDGGYILGGASKSPASGDKSQPNWDVTNATLDYWLVKTDINGNKLWDKRFGGTANDGMHSMLQTKDGGYVLGGYSYSSVSGNKTQSNWDVSGTTPDYWVVKTDASGTLQWNYRFGGTDYDELESIQQTVDGGYILGGYSASGATGDRTQGSRGGNDYWIVKLNSSGIKQWDKRFGGTGNDYLYTVSQTSDGGYILGGRSQSGISGDKSESNWDAGNITYDYWLVKTNGSGVKLWDKRFGGTGDDLFYSLKQTWDGGYILGGYSNSGINGDKTQATQGGNDYWIVKIASDGTKQWDQRYGGSGDEQLFTLLQTPEGGYLFGGVSSSGIDGDKTQASQGLKDYWIVKTGETGIKQWDAQYGGTKNDFLSALQQTADGGYVLAGYSFSGSTGDKSQANWDATLATQDYWMLKLLVGSGYAGFYPDSDNDGYGNPNVIRFACEAPAGYVTGNTDCNDNNDQVNPAAVDICNGVDDNCDGSIDENAIAATTSPSGAQEICNGSTLLLSAVPSGTSYTYQWMKDAIDISGATNSTYDASTAGDFNVEISNSLCASLSTTVTLVVQPLPLATISPAGTITICTGTNTTLTANAGIGYSYQWLKVSTPIVGATDQTYTTSNNEHGKFKVVVTSQNACTALSAWTKVKRNPRPDPVIEVLNGGNLDLCDGLVKLHGPGGPTAWQWYKASNPIAGATNRDYKPTTTGKYKVEITNNYDCTNKSPYVEVISSCKVGDISLAQAQLLLYPNPTDGHFVVSLHLNDEMNGIAIIQVYNSLGQTIIDKTAPLTDGELFEEINLSKKDAAGMYLVRVIFDGEVFTAQLVY